MNAIVVEGLSVHYGHTSVLWDLHFSLPPGTLVGIIGPNGAGKSTLLKALLGLVKPTDGTIRFFGLPLDNVRHRISYVPQRASVDWDFPMTGYDLVFMGRYPKIGPFRRPSTQDRALVEEALDRVGMLPLAQKHIGELSGGQQQRLLIARAYVQQGDLMLLDEPFTGVDLATEQAMVHLFKELKERGTTIVMVHHDLVTVQHRFDYLVLLNTCLIATGPTHEVLSHQNLVRTYGQGAHLLEEAMSLHRRQAQRD